MQSTSVHGGTCFGLVADAQVSDPTVVAGQHQSLSVIHCGVLTSGGCSPFLSPGGRGRPGLSGKRRKWECRGPYLWVDPDKLCETVMVILMCRRAPARRGLGVNTPQVPQRTAELVPNQLRFSTPPTLHLWGLTRRIPFGAAPFARLASVAGGRPIPARGRVPPAAASSTRSRTASGGTLGVTNHLVAGVPRQFRRVPLRDNVFRTGPLSAGDRVDVVHRGRPQHDRHFDIH